MEVIRHPSILRRDQALLLVVDVQEKLHAVMAHRERVTANVRRLVQGFQTLELPILVTEQYPKGLGPTVSEIRELFHEWNPYEKLTFSCCLVPEFCEAIQQSGATQIVLTGIETHVCILQTGLDLIQRGYQVHVPADAVSSRKELDWQMALERLRRAGAVITVTESSLFELLVRAGTGEFKQISALVK